MKKLFLILLLIVGVGALSYTYAKPDPQNEVLLAQYQKYTPQGKIVEAYYYNRGVSSIKIDVAGMKVVGVCTGYNRWEAVNASISRNNGGDSSIADQEWYMFTARCSYKARIGQFTVYFNM